MRTFFEESGLTVLEWPGNSPNIIQELIAVCVWRITACKVYTKRFPCLNLDLIIFAQFPGIISVTYFRSTVDAENSIFISLITVSTRRLIRLATGLRGSIQLSPFFFRNTFRKNGRSSIKTKCIIHFTSTSSP